MTAASRPVVYVPKARGRLRPARIVLYAFLTFMALTWLFPLIWAVIASLRTYKDTLDHGYISLPSGLNLDNYARAWTQGEFPKFYLNSLIVAVPSVILTLFLASMVAFAVTRFSWKFNLLCLMLFTAGNLLPPQVIIVPLYRLYNLLPLPAPLSDNGVVYDQYFGIILIHVAFQTGFCVFVLSNYMKTLSKELTEAALVDGAPVRTIYWSIILPLCRPALAALATLEFTFIYNDFFWALLLMKSGDKRPITSALGNLQGAFFTDTNLLAAGAMLAAIPSILVYIALQRQFIRGLALGASKG
ncbi:MAG: carbohydrate ABC transporter permease [Chloroflexota bacterium]|nr:carbohydrate ABC transporter permease [Chloroflexota bacterium]